MCDLVLNFQDRVFRMAFRVFGNASSAEDATADALATVWLRCGSWRGESQAGTWIYQVAWRVILDHQRSLRRWGRFWEFKEELISDVIDNPIDTIDKQEESLLRMQLVKEAMQDLSTEDRALVHMYYYDQKSLAEISIILGVSRDALKMRLSRIRKKLRSRIGENDESR